MSEIDSGLLLLVFPYDKLIFYAFGVFAASIIVRILYSFYCKKHFEECAYRFIVNWKLLKRMFSFAGWSVLGNLGFHSRIRDRILFSICSMVLPSMRQEA